MLGPGATGSVESARVYFDRLFAEAGSVRGQAIANLAFAQLVHLGPHDRVPGRPAELATVEDVANAFVLRMALSSARAIGIIPVGTRAAMEDAERLLSEGHYIPWPPPRIVARLGLSEVEGPEGRARHDQH